MLLLSGRANKLSSNLLLLCGRAKQLSTSPLLLSFEGQSCMMCLLGLIGTMADGRGASPGEEQKGDGTVIPQ